MIMRDIVTGDLRISIARGRGARIEPHATPHPPDFRGRRHFPPVAGPGVLLGRDREVAAALAAAPGRPVEFHAPSGFGRSTLLREVAARLSERSGVPVCYLHVGGDGPDDLRQRLVDVLYAPSVPVRPLGRQRAELLSRARAVFLLDDVSLGTRALWEVLDDLPQGTVIMSSDRPLLGRRGRSVPLTGLPAGTAREVLCHYLGRGLTPAERADAEVLCRLVGGQPARLRQAAALLGDGGHLVGDLAVAVGRDAYALDRLGIDALSESQQRALTVLAFAAGALLPPELVGAVAGLTGAGPVLASLVERGLVEQAQDRFGVPVRHADDYLALLTEHLTVGEAARAIVSWIGRQELDGEAALTAASAALSIIGYAAEDADWLVVARLVGAVEPILAFAGRWNAWNDALTWGREACRHLGDLAGQAHLDHQLGVHAYATGQVGTARQHWSEALRLHARLDDPAGAATTRAHLALAAPAPALRPLRRPRWRLFPSKGRDRSGRHELRAKPSYFQAT
jgi:hypothetical protein